MKTLFLDFDGVLNSVNGAAFVHVPLLASVLDGHEVEIVITSSHRIHQQLEHIIERLGPLGTRVAGVTPLIENGINRQREIDAWIASHGAEDFRVLDDDVRLFTKNWAPLILCSAHKGMDESAFDLIKRWLQA